MKIKKLTSIILAAMMTATAVPFNEVSVPYYSFPSYAVDAEANEIVAEGVCGENLTWSLNSKGTFTIEGEGAMDNWASPADVPWAEYTEQIKRISASDKLKNIGDYAFYGCVNIEMAFFSTIIGEHAYENSKNISGYTYYEDNTPAEIKDYAFYGCEKFKSITIKNPLCLIADSEFVFPEDFEIECYENSSAHEYAVKYGKEVDLIVVEVASGKCGENMKWVFESDGCLSLEGKGKMTNWNSPDEVPWAEYADQITHMGYVVGETESIGDYAFSNCTNLHSAVLFGELGNYIFMGCPKYGYVTVDQHPITAIKENTFTGAKGGTITINYPECYIADCETSIPENIKINCFEGSTAHNYALKYGREFELITDKAPVYPENPYVPEESETPDDNNSSENDEQGIAAEGTCGENLTWTLNENGTLTISGEGDMENYYVLVSSVPTDKLTNTPWDDLKSIRKIVIEEGVKSIGNFAFADCQNLKSVTIPDSVTNIGEHAFYRCSTLETVTIPESVTSIGKGAFNSSGISEFEINNPKCVIADSSDVFPENAVIYSNAGSTAQTYAEKYNIEFVTLTDNDDSDSPEIDGPIVIASGICGENLTWEAYNEGSLMIFGEGSMADYTTPEDVPWAEYASEVSYVEISETVDYIGENTFISCENAYTISIMNPECVFAESPDIFHANSVICGYPGSTTADYAEKYNMDYTDFSLTIAEGTCGENLVWEIYDTGALSIYGEGEMYDYANPEDAPWVEYVNDIFSVFISSANISENALVSCKNASVVCINDPYCVIPDSTNVFPENAAICGDAGSTAEKYALKYGREFEAWTDIDDLEQGVIASGKLGENIEWVLTDNGAIYFDGEGDMPDFDGVTPWSEYTSLIRTVSMSEEITSIGDYAFYGCENLVSGALTSVIGAHAYEGCKRMNSYSYYGDVSPINEIKDCAFKGCYSLWAIPIANPDCIIADSENVFDNNTAIEGYVGSTAHKYAEKYERDFQNITLIDIEGSCGKSLYWYMTSDGMLGINGSGKMDNYSEDITAAPWYSYVKDITSICINDFTSDDDAIELSKNCFAMCENAKIIYFYNSGCIIADSAETIPENTVILGYEGSTAQKYAEKYNRKFNAIPTTDATGTLNEEFTWELNSEGILYITGFGAMDDYTDSNPWGEYADKITSVYFYGNVTSIGKNAFSHCKNLEFVDIDESIEFIDMDAFSGCNKLDYLNFHGNKKCVIYDNASTIPAHTELIGHFGSPLHEYADTYERSFYWIDGDINEDSSVDASDASMVLDEYSNIQTGGKAKLSSIETTTADVTNDNVVDAADSSAILQYYAKASTGQNPTWD